MSHFKCLDKYIIMTQPIGRERESQAIYTHHIVNSESQCGECRINKNLWSEQKTANRNRICEMKSQVIWV